MGARVGARVGSRLDVAVDGLALGMHVTQRAEHLEIYREIWGDIGRCREIQGDAGRSSACSAARGAPG